MATSDASFSFDRPEYERQVGDILLRKLNNVGLLIEASAAVRSPVDTGNLRRSIASQSPTLLPGGAGAEVKVIAKAEYAVYVHQGTRYMRARPFLRNAAEEIVGRLT